MVEKGLSKVWRGCFLSGICLFGSGVVGDAAAHLLPPPALGWAESVIGPEGYWAHAVTAAGMLVILIGTAANALRPPGRRAAERGNTLER